jgi:hypothetical protein
VTPERSAGATSTTPPTAGPDFARELLERCATYRPKYGDDAVCIVPVGSVEAMAGAVLELHALRSLLAGLPDDDWQPFDWAVFTMAQEEARERIGGPS